MSGKYWSLIPGGWSIQTEVFQYVLFPLLRKKRIRYFVLGSIIWIYLGVNFMKGSFSENSAISNLAWSIERISLIPCALFFFAGILSAEIQTESVSTDRIRNFLKIHKFFTFSFLISLVLTFFANQINHSVAEALFMIMLYLGLALLVTNFHHPKLTFRWIGTHSYFIYFFHFQITLFIQRFDLTNQLSLFQGNIYLETCFWVLTIFVISFPIAELSMRLLEKPLIKLGHRIS